MRPQRDRHDSPLSAFLTLFAFVFPFLVIFLLLLGLFVAGTVVGGPVGAGLLFLLIAPLTAVLVSRWRTISTAQRVKRASMPAVLVAVAFWVL